MEDERTPLRILLHKRDFRNGCRIKMEREEAKDRTEEERHMRIDYEGTQVLHMTWEKEENLNFISITKN